MGHTFNLLDRTGPFYTQVLGGEMEVSDIKPEPDGKELIQTVVSLTGLPEELILPELDQLLEMSGHGSHDITLQQLRIAMLEYLEAVQADLFAEEIPE